MKLTEILKMRGINDFSRIKLVRHKDNKIHDLKELYEAGKIIDYQSVQSKNVFDGCDFIISFLGIERSKSKFIGMYEITERKKVADITPPANFPYKDFYNNKNDNYYVMKELKILDDLKERIIIDWGKAAINWAQWLKNNDKEIIEILPKGYFDSFPGFLDFTLTFNDLKRIVDNPDSNREWHRMLGSVAGVYLILDTVDGLQYIGSASGKDGIIGRWTDYAKSLHGGNKLLEELLNNHPDRYKSFQFTILQTLPLTLTRKEVNNYEKKYKEKLGSRAFGLNHLSG